MKSFAVDAPEGFLTVTFATDGHLFAYDHNLKIYVYCFLSSSWVGSVKLGTLLMQSYVSPLRKFDVTSLTSAVGLWHRLVVLVCVGYSVRIQ